MKKNDVELGATYAAKVSGKLARVRIERESPYGGWDATNVDTGRSVRIKSAQRLRRAIGNPRRATANSAAAENPDVCATVGCGRPVALTYLGRARCQACYEDEVAAGDDMCPTTNNEETAMATTKKTSRKSATKTAKTTKTAKQAKAAKPKAEPAGDAKPKRTSALDAAAEVLKKAAQPMRAQEMITAMTEQGLWSSPNGKTPHATLYAAILREINDKGGEARFRKADRGLFEHAGQ